MCWTSSSCCRNTSCDRWTLARASNGFTRMALLSSGRPPRVILDGTWCNPPRSWSCACPYNRTKAHLCTVQCSGCSPANSGCYLCETSCNQAGMKSLPMPHTWPCEPPLQLTYKAQTAEPLPESDVMHCDHEAPLGEYKAGPTWSRPFTLLGRCLMHDFQVPLR